MDYPQTIFEICVAFIFIGVVWGLSRYNVIAHLSYYESFLRRIVKKIVGILGCLKINLLLCTLFYGSSLKAEGKDAARGDMRTEMAAIKTLVVNFIDKR